MTALPARRIVVIGGGGHAKVVVDLLRTLEVFEIVGCLDAGRTGGDVLGVPVIGGDAAIGGLRATGVDCAVVAIGDNARRERLALSAIENGFVLPALVAPSAVVSATATLGAGTVVMPRAVVHTAASVGMFVIVNTGAIVEHDCVVGNAAHVAPGSVLCGSVEVGDRTLFGAKATTRPGVRIAADVVVGAGPAVVGDITRPGRYGGAPARALAGKV